MSIQKVLGKLAAGFGVGCLAACGGGGDGGASGGITAGKFTILGTKTDGGDGTEAKKNAENTLVKFPDVDALVGLWAYNAPACLEAVKGAGKVGEVKIFSFDEDEATLQGIVDGTIEGTIVQQPYQFGYLSVKYLKDIADGKEIEVPENKEIEVPAKTITDDNVKAFWDDLKGQQAIYKEAQGASLPASGPKFSFVINGPDPFWTYAEAGCYQASKDFGVRCDFQAPPNGEPAEQNRILEDILTKGGYSGVAVSPLDPANQTAVLNEVAAAMPLLCHDSDAPDSERRFYLGTNNVEAGRMLGRMIKKRMPEGGKIMVFVGNLDVLNAQQRRQGLIEELGKE